MKEIKLTKGMVALVDDADFEWLIKIPRSTLAEKKSKMDSNDSCKQ